MTWILRVVSALVIAAAGLGAGVAIANVTSGTDSPDIVAQVDGAEIYDCPAGARVVGYTPGTRVFVTARDDDGLWYQIRDLDVPAAPLWVRSADIELDDPTAALPIRDCGSSDFALAADTTTTTVDTSTTTTTTPTSTTVATTTTTTPPSTVPPDTTPPVISGLDANPNKIWEEDTQSLSCPPTYERQSLLSATVTDSQSGVASVTAQWVIQGSSGSLTLSVNGSAYSGTFGPFPYLTIPDQTDEIVTITVRARDVAGNESKTTVGVRLHSLGTCP